MKKDVKSKLMAKNGCDGKLIVKILIMTIKVNLVPNRSKTKRPHKFVIKILAATLDFPSFSQWPSSGPYTFLQLGFFD